MVVMTLSVAEWKEPSLVPAQEHEPVLRKSNKMREKEREPVTGEMRRNAGQDRAGTQRWQGSCQVAMPGEASGDARPASRGSFCWFNVVFVSDQRVLALKRSADLRARSHFEFEMKLRFERKPFRDYEEQGEKAAPIASPGGVLSVGSGVWCKEPTDPFTII